MEGGLAATRNIPGSFHHGLLGELTCVMANDESKMNSRLVPKRSSLDAAGRDVINADFIYILSPV